jgi:hypothetical protein
VQVAGGEACVYSHNAATAKSIKLCGPGCFPVIELRSNTQHIFLFGPLFGPDVL